MTREIARLKQVNAALVEKVIALEMELDSYKKGETGMDDCEF